ncbi:MAG: hypothetical protein HQK63_06330 [Desulfamplus sp.]|nr:hypothetical protein [Desulfamplus sp.]
MDLLDDNITNDEKRQKREKYIDDCLGLFCNKHSLKILYSKYTAKRINIIYWEYALKRIKNLMEKSDGRVDHHKIISGMQCAIMAGCLLRTEETINIKIQGEDSKVVDSIRAINADFALYIALDILEQWNGIDIQPLRDRESFVKEHCRWLKNIAVLNDKKQMSFPFFAVSQLWYLAEELCIAETHG